MYKIYKTVKGKLINPETPVENSWVDISAPEKEELIELENYFKIPEEVIVSVKDPDEVPKFEEVDDFNFILIQTPIETKEGYTVNPLGILYNKDLVITISYGSNDTINYIKSKLKNFEKNHLVNTNEFQQVILKLILFSSKIYLRYLKEMNRKIHSGQEEMLKNPQNKDIMSLMDLGKSLTYFNRSLHSNQLVIEKLSKRKAFSATEEDADLLQDVIDENKQAHEVGKIYENIVTSTANTFATIISNNLNQSVKFLTSITIILMLPTLVASIYGMNVALPFQNSPYAFDIVMTMCLLIIIIGVVLFYRRKYF